MKTSELNDAELSGFDAERRWISESLHHSKKKHALRGTLADLPTRLSMLELPRS